MKKDMEIVYNNIEDVCSLIYIIIDAGIDYYENDGGNNSEINFIDIVFDTYIYMFTEDGLYVDLYLYELRTEDLQTLKNAVKYEYESNNITMIATYNSAENVFKTNYSKFTVSDIGKVCGGKTTSLNYEHIRNIFAPITNRNLAQSLEQGFTLDMVNNLENWNYD